VRSTVSTAVAYVDDIDGTSAFGGQLAVQDITVSGTNPVLLVLVGANAPDGVSIMSIDLGLGLTGTPSEVVTEQASLGNGMVLIWVITAPAGSGDITINFSSNITATVNVLLLEHAHQTTPCPLGDVAIGNTPTSGTTISLLPTNLTANDAAVGIGASTNDGGDPVFDQVQTFNDMTFQNEAAAGYHLGTGPVSITWASFDDGAAAAVRVVGA